QQSGRCGMQVADGMEGVVAFFDQALAARQEGMAGFCQRDAASGAIKQAGLQSFFEARELAADMGRRNPQSLGGPHEATAFSDRDELIQTFPAIHLVPRLATSKRRLSLCSNNVSMIRLLTQIVGKTTLLPSSPERDHSK